MSLEALRACLAEPPGLETWEQLAEALEAIPPGADRELAQGYAAGHLDAWEDHSRQLEWRWLGTDHPLLPLCRTLFLTRQPPPAVLRRLAQEPGLTGLRALVLFMAPPAVEDAALLADAPWCAGLHHLSVFAPSEHGSLEWLRRLLLGVAPGGLRELSLSGSFDGAEVIELLTSCPALRELETLGLQGVRFDDAALAQLLVPLSRLPLSGLSLGGSGFKEPVADALPTLLPRLSSLRHLSLSGAPIGAATARALAQLPQLAALESLNLATCWMDADAAAALLQAPWTGGLRRLNLGGNRLGDAGAQALAAAPQLASLHHLALDRCSLGAAGLQALAAAPLPHLQTLDLSHNTLDDLAAAALARASWLPGLQSLRVALSQLTAVGAAALLAAPLPALHTLDLSYNALGAPAARALAAASLPALRHLNLRATTLDAAAARALGAAPWLPHLHGARLGDNALCDAGVASLLAGPRALSLRTLELDKNRLGAAAADVLAQTPALSNLLSLDLRENAITDAGAQALAQPASLTALRKLDLNRNDLGPLAAHALAASTTLPRLATLRLGQSHLGDEGARALAQTRLPLRDLSLTDARLTDAAALAFAAAHLPQLESLGLGQNNLTDAALAAFLSAAGLPRLHTLDLSYNLLSPEAVEALEADEKGEVSFYTFRQR